MARTPSKPSVSPHSRTKIDRDANKSIIRRAPDKEAKPGKPSAPTPFYPTAPKNSKNKKTTTPRAMAKGGLVVKGKKK